MINPITPNFSWVEESPVFDKIIANVNNLIVMKFRDGTATFLKSTVEEACLRHNIENVFDLYRKNWKISEGFMHGQSAIIFESKFEKENDLTDDMNHDYI